MGIYIFCRPVHSGKTTELLSWCNKQDNIAGILMPDMDGGRKIYNIKTKDIFDIECLDPANCTEPLTTVGRFNFYTSAFEKANSILLNELCNYPDWVVIDEAGKLELDGKGFYSALKTIVDLYKSNTAEGNLLIIVRDSLCDAVISFFEIEHCKIIHQLQELEHAT